MIRPLIKAAMRGTPLIALDYDVEPTPRWGFGKPPHPRLQALLAERTSDYAQLLLQIATYRFDFLAIPERATSTLEPSRTNDYFSGLDSLALYALLRMRRPQRYLEIGSGNSTRFAARAIRDEGSHTKITSIDPRPRAEIDMLAHRIVRTSLENVDQEIFRELEPGDFLFFDGSHYCLQNSDVVTFFLEILPELPSGVVVQVHDIRLPYDYPPKLKRHWYAEQYILAMYLLSSPKPTVLLPNYFVWEQPQLRAFVEDIGGGNSFWFVT